MMRKYLAIISLLFSGPLLAQEEYGITEKVKNYSVQEISSAMIKSINRSFVDYNKYRKTPNKYLEVVLGKQDKLVIQKYFESSLKRPLPKLQMNKKSEFVFKQNNYVMKFTLDQLFKSTISINAKMVKVPTGKSLEETIFLLNSEIQNAVNTRKSTSSFSLIESTYATDSDLDDKKVKSLYNSDRFVSHQATQGLVLSLLLLYKDIGVSESGFIANRRLKKSLINFYNHISKLAKSCTEEKENTNGKFKSQSNVVKNLKAIDLVNAELHRKNMDRKEWSREISVFVWTRLKYNFKDPRRSFNICKSEPLIKVYKDANLCKNLEKLTNCLIAFRSSGKISETRLDETEMSNLFTNEYDIKNIDNLMER